MHRKGTSPDCVVVAIHCDRSLHNDVFSVVVSAGREMILLNLLKSIWVNIYREML